MLNKQPSYEIHELTTYEEMAGMYCLIKQLYPKMGEGVYREKLARIVKIGYQQVGFYEQGQCVGLAGYKLEEELYRGKMMRLEDLVVDGSKQGSGIGSKLLNYMQEKASELGCETVVLESLDTHADKAPEPLTPLTKFYLNNGYIKEGGAFCLMLNGGH